MSGRKELIEYRTSNTKHFLKRDGTIEVEIYKDPVHYLDKGKYKEIDNSLVKTTKGFKNKSNNFKIEFDEKDSDSLVNISCKNKKISMFPKNINQKISNRSSAKKSRNSLISNSISYESMYEGVDIDYKVLSNQLKESIILNKIPKENKFVFVINTDLTLILNEDKTISFMDKSKECYKIEKPYMVDKNNIYSDSVTYELEKIDNGYEITIIADKEWLNDKERAYPVVIDPTITNLDSKTSVIDKCIYSGPDYLCKVDEQLLAIGTDLYENKYRTLLKFELPKIPVGYKVIDANVSLICNINDYFGINSFGPLVSVHEVTKDWSETSATWNSMNNDYSDKIEDYYQSTLIDPLDVFSGAEVNYFNISNLVQKWYNGEHNYGIMLKENNEIYDENCKLAYYVAKDCNDGVAKPLLRIKCKNFNGIESYLSYTSQSHYFGSSHINNYTGNLTTTFNVANTIGGSFPASIYLVYNTNDIELGNDYGCGLGVKPNLIQTIKKEIIEDVELLAYLDEDGTTHYFRKRDDDSYTDEDGLGLSINMIDDNYLMTDKNSNTNKFVKHDVKDDNYYLEEIKDTNDKIITIKYDQDNRITEVIDATNHIIEVNYENNKITFVSPHLETVVNLTNNLITSITSLGDTETITYNSNKLIEKIENPNGLSIKYEYLNNLSYKVIKVSEISKEGNIGNYLTFNYNLSDTKITDNKGRFNTCIFNSYGNVEGITSIDADNNLNNAYGKSYSFSNEEDETINKLIADKSLIKYVNNLIDDSSFETSNSVFISSDNGIVQSLSNDARSGLKALKIINNKLGSYVYKNIVIDNKKEYTFSLYLKNTIPVDLKLSYDNKEEVLNILDINNKYCRYELTINHNINNSSTLKISIEPMGIGEILIDDIQLEESEVANYYNLVTNSNFKNGTSEWDIKNFDSDLASACNCIVDNVSALKINSNPEASICIDKLFNISGKEGDTFNLSFWYKNNGIIPTGFIGEGAGVTATIFFYYKDDLDGTCVPMKTLNVGSDNWQFFSENFTAEKDYANLQIRILSNCGANETYVTNFSLFKDLESYSYVYDDNGNLVSTTSLNKEKREMCYDKNNQLINTMSPLGANYKFEYDNNATDRLINAISPTGITNHIEYDRNGNPVKTRINNRNTFAEIDNDKVYYIRAKGTNKYFYINPDKSVRMKESECSYDKFYILKHNVTLEVDGQEVVTTYVKIKHASLNNYFIKVINNDVRLMYGDNDNTFELISNINSSYSIAIPAKGNEPRKVLSLTDIFNVELAEYEDSNYKQELFFEQSDNKLFIESSAEYTDDGRFIKSIKDSLDNKVIYDINLVNGLTNSITDPNGNSTNYTYDNKFRIINITKGTHKVDYEYDNNNLSKIKHGTKNYLFNYDEFNNTSSIRINDTTLINNYYEENNCNLTKIKYGNGHEINYTYDKYDRIKSITKSNDNYTNYYDNLGRLTKITSNNDTYNYEYDFAKRLSKFKYNDYSTEYEYDKNNNIVEKLESLNSIKNVYNYEYNKESALTKLSVSNNNFNYVYDKLGRLTESNINNIYKTKYSYITRGNKTSTMIDKFDDNGIEYSYTYDKLGNISEVKKNSVLINKYYYDEHSQLIKEDDLVNNLIKEYSYDNYGNILRKRVYQYNSNILVNEDTYSYEDSNWQDLLTKFNNESIIYDAIGNPLSIGNKTLTWMNGRELKSYNDGTNTISYKYNADGIRTSKVVNGLETKYYLEGSSVIFEDRNGSMIYYIYSDNDVLGFAYNGNSYYYHKTIFGDIIGILDSNYNEVVSYEYDSWGALVNITDNSNINLGTINPFRYRSYYYDTETKMYYLNSRYYSPQVGRFINSDGYTSVSYEIGGDNMFSYCENIFIGCYDAYGQDWKSFKKKIKDFFSKNKKSYRTTGAAKPYKEIEETPRDTEMNAYDHATNYIRCYSYALDLSVTHNPGFKVGNEIIKFYEDYGDIKKVVKATKKDLKALGRGVREIAGPSGAIYENEYRIAVRTTGRIGYDSGYHFMVQTDTGQWADKPGDGASRLWDLGLNPNNIDWTDAEGNVYNSKIVYLAVTY